MKYSAPVLLALTIALAACGGGGTTLSSAPDPEPVPTPTPTPSGVATDAAFLGEPGATQEYPTFTAGDPLRVRYNADTQLYEVSISGERWENMYGDSQFGPGHYQIPGPMEDVGTIDAFIRPDHPDPAMRFQYSSLAGWSYGLDYDKPENQKSGVIAFGASTPAGGAPLTGAATYLGPILGSANIPAESGWGDLPRAPINGTVSLNFDFGRGTLSGEIRPQLACDCDPIDFPKLAFADTVVAAGSSSYSGRFATSVAGPNAFAGLFTGPHGEELIGHWAFPFLNAGAVAAAEGVWAAKRD